MTAGQTRAFDISESACGISSTATAYSLNVTMVAGAEAWLPGDLAHGTDAP